MQKVLIEVAETESPHSLFNAINNLKVMGSIVYVVTNSPIISAALITVLGNLNKAIIVNGCIVKSFDAAYQVGKYVGEIHHSADLKINL
jgi:hypothetical protein